jgi:hypothetical protein
MASKNDQYDMDHVDNNIKKLLVSALPPVSASASFKLSLLVRIKEELVRINAGASRQLTSSPALEQNLGRLMASAYEQTKAVPGFKDRLRYQLITTSKAERRKRRLSIWAPAVAASAVLTVLLLGMVIYPTFWADRGPTVTATVSKNIAQVTQIKPVFFNLINRAVTTTLGEGDEASLSVGEWIVTGAGASAVLTLPGENTIILYPDSKMGVSELIVDDDSGTALASLKLDRGMASNKFSGFMVDVNTPTATASIEGTAFRIEVISAEHTFLVTREGTVQLTMDGDSVQVSAGEEVHAEKGQLLVVEAERPPMLIIESPDRPEVYSETITMSGKTDVEATLTVNDKPVQVDINGSFSTSLSLEPGANSVSVIATSPTGKTITLDLVFIRM